MILLVWEIIGLMRINLSEFRRIYGSFFFDDFLDDENFVEKVNNGSKKEGQSNKIKVNSQMILANMKSDFKIKFNIFLDKFDLR